MSSPEFNPIVMPDYRRGLVRMVEGVTQNADGSHTFHINATSSGETFLYGCLMCGAQFYDPNEIVAARKYHDHPCAAVARLQEERTVLQAERDEAHKQLECVIRQRKHMAEKIAGLKRQLGETVQEMKHYVFAVCDERDAAEAVRPVLQQTIEMVCAELTKVAAERDALQSDAELGALVRQMPVGSELHRSEPVRFFYRPPSKKYTIHQNDPLEVLKAANVGSQDAIPTGDSPE